MKLSKETLKKISIMKIIQKSKKLSAKEIYESNYDIFKGYQNDSSKFQHICKLLKQLVDSGFLTKDSERKYSVTEEGLSFIDIEEQNIIDQFWEDLKRPFRELEKVYPYVI